MLALVYLKYTIRRDKFDWEEEEEDEEGEGTGGGLGGVEDGSEETDKGEEEKIGFDQVENGDLKTANSTNTEKPVGFAKNEKQKKENNWPDNISHTGEF